jgi:hypothetical protein
MTRGFRRYNHTMNVIAQKHVLKPCVPINTKLLAPSSRGFFILVENTFYAAFFIF